MAHKHKARNYAIILLSVVVVSLGVLVAGRELQEATPEEVYEIPVLETYYIAIRDDTTYDLVYEQEGDLSIHVIGNDLYIEDKTDPNTEIEVVSLKNRTLSLDKNDPVFNPPTE